MFEGGILRNVRVAFVALAVAMTFVMDATSSRKLRVKVRRDAARVLAPDHVDLP